jgi:photosystem II stability/assembly factor-like uncharacterized protein
MPAPKSRATSGWQPIGPEQYYCHAAWADGRGEVLIVGQHGLLRSVDAGDTLVTVKPLKRPFFTSVCRGADGAIYLGDTKGTLQTSRDHGASWVRAAFPRAGRVNALVPLPEQTFALAGNKVFHWGLGGEDWFEETPAPKQAQLWHQTLFTDGRSRLFLVGGSAVEGAKGYLLTSTDGRAWTELPLPEGTPGLTCGMALGQECYLGGYYGTLLASADGGATWRVLPVPGKVHQLFGVWGSGKVILCIADNAILRSEDAGASWTPAFKSDRYRAFDALVASGTGHLYAIGTDTLYRAVEPLAKALPAAPVAGPEAVAKAHPALPVHLRTAWEDRLDRLLEAWRATRHPDLADLIERVGARAEGPLAGELRRLGGDTLQTAWLELAQRGSPAEAGALCATAASGHLPEVLQRMAALGRLPDDPRLAACAAAWVKACPFGSTSSKPAWTVAFGVLERCADSRSLPVLQAAKKKGLPVTGKTMATSLAAALDRSLAQVTANVQRLRRPLSPAQEALRDEVAQALGG